MTIGAIYDLMSHQLKAVYDDREAASIAGLVLESRLGIRRIDRILRKTEPLDEAGEAQLQSDLRVLLQNRPVQYVLGEAWFDGLLLKVNEHVLIPRPETEELVHWVVGDRTTFASEKPTLQVHGAAGQRTADPGMADWKAPGLSILDIGTGSGCIPIALKKHLPAASITGLDVSPEAVLLATENAYLLSLPVQFRTANILDVSIWSNLPNFDIIISNPPYIADFEKNAMHPRVLEHEPHLALFVAGDDPLLFYRKIAQFAMDHLSPGGALYLEINEALGEETLGLLRTEGFTQVILKKDLQGKDRMIRARSPE